MRLRRGPRLGPPAAGRRRYAVVAALVLGGGCRTTVQPILLPDIAGPVTPSGRSTPETWMGALTGVRWVQRLETSKVVARAGRPGTVLLAAGLEAAGTVGGRTASPKPGADQKVVVAALSIEGSSRWMTLLGGTGTTTVDDMVVSGDGAITIAGSYNAPIALGPDRLALDPASRPSSISGYLARLDSGGVVRAARGPLPLGQRVVAAGDAGAVVVSGGSDLEVEAVDDHLAPRWLVRCSREGTNKRPAVAGLGRSGAVIAGDAGAGVVCTDRSGSARAPAVTAAGAATMFIARILDDGKVAWVIGVAGEGSVAGLAVAANGRMALGVNAGDRARLVLTDDAGAELAAARFTPEPGAKVRIAAVSIEPDGGAVVAGDFEGAIDAVGARLEARGRDVFVARIGLGGALMGARRLGDQQIQRAAGVTLDGAGGVVVVGHEPIQSSDDDRSTDNWFVLDLTNLEAAH